MDGNKRSQSNQRQRVRASQSAAARPCRGWDEFRVRVGLLCLTWTSRCCSQRCSRSASSGIQSRVTAESQHDSHTGLRLYANMQPTSAHTDTLSICVSMHRLMNNACMQRHVHVHMSESVYQSLPSIISKLNTFLLHYIHVVFIIQGICSICIS